MDNISSNKCKNCLLRHRKAGQRKLPRAIAAKNALFIINPVSGKLRAKTFMFDMLSVMSQAGCSPTVSLTRYSGHARELAALAESRGYSQIFCCGGDGTLNEVLSGLVSSDSHLPVGYIPAGSTNDFAASLGIPLDLTASARSAVSGKAFTLDLGAFGNDRYFTYIASFGAFTAASYSAPQIVKNSVGYGAYVFEGIKEFFKIKPIKVSCKMNGSTVSGEYIFGGVSNSFSVGGLVKLDENDVDLNDGIFEVVLVKQPKNLDEFNQIVQAILNKNLNCPMFVFEHTSEVSFEFDEPIDWTLDGECAEKITKVNIKALHNAVTLRR